MSDTATETVAHPLDSLHRLLTEMVARLPWHSEDQFNQMMALARDSEVALKGDAIDSSPAVVPPAPVLPVPADPLAAAAAAAGAGIDYDKLAKAIVTAQAQLEKDRATQAAQADEAVAANPGWVPPGSVTAPGGEGHAGADAVSS